MPAANDNGDVFEFNGANDTDPFNFTAEITGETEDSGTKEAEIMVQINYVSSFWRTLEMHLINCEINLILTWSGNCVVVYTDIANQGATFAVTETKLSVPAVTLSTQHNAKLLRQLKSEFKKIINRNKYLSKTELLTPNQNLNHLVEPSFQGVNTLLF